MGLFPMLEMPPQLFWCQAVHPAPLNPQSPNTSRRSGQHPIHPNQTHPTVAYHLPHAALQSSTGCQEGAGGYLLVPGRGWSICSSDPVIRAAALPPSPAGPCYDPDCKSRLQESRRRAVRTVDNSAAVPRQIPPISGPREADAPLLRGSKFRLISAS